MISDIKIEFYFVKVVNYYTNVIRTNLPRIRNFNNFICFN